MGHPMRFELTCEGLLVKLANHYTSWGAYFNIKNIKSKIQLGYLSRNTINIFHVGIYATLSLQAEYDTRPIFL